MASIEAIIMVLADHVTTTHHLDRGTVNDHGIRALDRTRFFPLGTNKSTVCTNAA